MRAGCSTRGGEAGVRSGRQLWWGEPGSDTALGRPGWGQMEASWGDISAQGGQINRASDQAQAQLHHSRRCSSGGGQVVEALLKSSSQGRGFVPRLRCCLGASLPGEWRRGAVCSCVDLALSPGWQASRRGNALGALAYTLHFKLLRVVQHWYIYLFHSLERFLNPYLEPCFFQPTGGGWRSLTKSHGCYECSLELDVFSVLLLPSLLLFYCCTGT